MALQRLNSIGVTGIVLKYRVPRGRSRHRAWHRSRTLSAGRLSLVRTMPRTRGIDPPADRHPRVFRGRTSLGRAATDSDQRRYEAMDRIKVDCRPDFAVLVYPAYLAEKRELVPEIRVTSATPPTFLVHASNDGIGPENSIALYLALKKAGVPAELHVYTTGGHGFGLHRANTHVPTGQNDARNGSGAVS